MKFAAALLSFALTSIFAHAEPKIGDKVNYNFTRTSAGITSVGVMTFEFTAYDSAKDEWTQSVDVTMNGKVEHQEQKVAANKIISDEMVQNILTRCEEANGKPEVLQISTGSLNTCKLPAQSGFVWIADVPVMRVAKLKTSDKGTETDITVTSFARGQ